MSILLTSPAPLFIYCALAYWLGYATFKRLDAADGPARELSLHPGLDALFAWPMTKVFSRFHGPFAALLGKEFRIQQPSYQVAGAFVLIAVAGFCLVRRDPEVSASIVGGFSALYMLILPMIAGALSVVEEKGWGVAGWHMTLPPSALKQWSAKMVAALSTGLVLGLLLPAAIGVAYLLLLGQLDTEAYFLLVLFALVWAVVSLFLTSVAAYAASFSRNILQGILAAVAVIVAGGVVLWLAATGVSHVIDRPHLEEWMKWSLVSGGLVFMLCLFQGFAWSNFRRCGPPTRLLLVQLSVLLLSGYLTAWAIARFF